MTPELRILLASASIVCAAMLGYQAGWRARGAQPRRDYSSAAIARLVWQQHRRGSNPPPPGGKPAPPAGPPCNGGEITLAQWEAMRTPFTEGPVQRGNGNGGPTTPKPNIIPKPQFPPPLNP